MRLRPMLPADHADVLALNEANVELLAPLEEARLVQLQSWADTAAVIDVDGALAGFVLTFVSGSAYDSENFGWFSDRFGDFCYLDRIVIHEDFRRRGLGTAVYDELESSCGRAAVRPRGQPGPAQRGLARLPPRTRLRGGGPAGRRRPPGLAAPQDPADRQLTTSRPWWR